MPRPPVSLDLPSIDSYLEECSALCKRPSVAELADRLGMHRITLNQKFRLRFAMTVLEYFLSWRHARTRERIVTSDVKMVVVALEAGYRSSRAFERSFAAREGVTPAAFRKSIKTTHEMPSPLIDGR